MNVPVKIPQQGDILIEVGQSVDFTTPLVKKGARKTVEIPLASLMGFTPDKIFLKVKKTIGDSVTKGDILAEDKSFLSTKRYLSQIDGVLREIHHDSGTLIIEQESTESSTQPCYFQGVVVAIHDGFIELKVKDSHKARTSNQVEYMGAEIYYAPSEGIPFSEDEIDGKCIFTLEFNPMDHPKVEALGARALILNKAPQESGRITQIVLHEQSDMEHVSKKRYPYFIVGPEENTLYFYE